MDKEERRIGGRYVYKKSLGKGGNGSVFLCYDTKLGKEWAVKCMRYTREEDKKETTAAETTKTELRSELEALKTVTCNAFPRIVDVIQENQMIYLVMDYVEGITLKEKMSRQKISEKEVLPWAVEIAGALRYLHRMSPQILYLDCKPENIMLTEGGEIRMVDLGSAYLCQTEHKQRLSGTSFFAPEELKNRTENQKTPDERTDIYIFGMTLYCLLAGKRKKYRRNGRISVRDVNPGVSYGMDAMIAKCTERDMAKRYQSMDEVLYQLAHLKELGRKEREKRGLVKMAEWTGKGIAAIGCLLAASQYVAEQQSVSIGFGFFFFLCLLMLCKQKRLTVYEVKQDLFRGSGKRMLSVAILCLGFLAGSHMSSYAAEKTEEKELAVTVYDNQWRKLLIKEGASWGVEQDIFMSVPIGQISKKGGKITVLYAEEGSETTQIFSFQCHRK